MPLYPSPLTQRRLDEPRPSLMGTSYHALRGTSLEDDLHEYHSNTNLHHAPRSILHRPTFPDSSNFEAGQCPDVHRPQLPITLHLSRALSRVGEQEMRDDAVPTVDGDGRLYHQLPYEHGSIDEYALMDTMSSEMVNSASTRTHMPHVYSYDASSDSQPLAPPVPRRNGESNSQHGVRPLWRVWTFEVACLMLSYILFSGIVLILWMFDGSGLPDWPLRMTLNSLLAFLTTLATAALTVPVSTAVGQIQWTWFNQERPRPLYDLHVIDQASRGAWGSLLLLSRFRVQHFVVIGALILATSGLISPLTQLAINYPTRNETTSETEQARLQAVWHLGDPRDHLSQATSNAIFLALTRDQSEFQQPISYMNAAKAGSVSCLTGNCTFDPYHTFGVCVKFANISSHLQVEEFANQTLVDIETTGSGPDDMKLRKASLPNGHSIAHYGSVAGYLDNFNGNVSFGFQDELDILQARIASFGLIYTTPTIYNNTDTQRTNLQGLEKDIYDFKYEAVEIVYYLCVQKFQTQVHMGTEDIQLLDSFTNPLRTHNQSFLDIDCGPIRDGIFGFQRRKERGNETLGLKSPIQKHPYPAELSSSGGEGIFRANYGAMEGMARAMQQSLCVTASLSIQPEDVATGKIRFWGNGEVLDLLFSASKIFQPGLRLAGLENYFRSIATILSAQIHYDKPRVAYGTMDILGRAQREMAYVSIKWHWISVLAVEIAFATAFLLLTMASQTSDRKVAPTDPSTFREVKGSSLAALVALSEDCRAAAGGRLRPKSQMESIAKTLKVRLEGDQLVVAEDGSTVKVCD